MVKSTARFTPFQRGRIIGQAEAGAPRRTIQKVCRKKDGTQANMTAMDAIIAHGRNPEYEGEDSSSGGRPKELTKQEEAKLKQLIFSEVGLARLSIQFV